MVIKPMVRSNVCINAHPQGCKKSVEDQIAYTKERAKSHKETPNTPKKVLVLGCSNGYGLASRIVASFAYGAPTIGVSFEKAGSETKGGTPGWYNNLAFDQAATKTGIYTKTIDGDAFSDEIKTQVIEEAKAQNMKFDLVVYSLASPVRVDPETGIMHKSVIKPFGKVFEGTTIDPFTSEVKQVSAEPATEDEAAATVKVMGGEDWERWIAQLTKADLLADGCITLAYSYIGPEATHALYRNGTIGKAKEHLEATAHTLTDNMKAFNGKAFVSVNKGLVTRASAVIPVIPLYLASLFTVMKAKGTHEGCIEQINRMYDSFLYREDNVIPVDEKNRIRIDDWEMDADVQAKVDALMPTVTNENAESTIDLAGYRHDFYAASGFDIDGIDYEADIARMDTI